MSGNKKTSSITADIVVFGGSAGSFLIIKNLIKSLPANYPAPVIIVVHRMKDGLTDTAMTLQYNTSLKVCDASDKSMANPGEIIIAPADYHLLMEAGGYLSLDCSGEVNYSRPSIDVFFESVADSGVKNVLAVLVSGANQDGAAGLKAIHDAGGTTIVEDPATAQFSAMPEAALSLFQPDYVVPSDEIIDLLKNIHHS